MRPIICLAFLSLAVAAGVPTINELLQCKTARGAVISPDGKFWVAETGTGRTWPLTPGKKSAGSPAWSHDGQLFALRPNGGEAMRLTKTETGVQGLEWPLDGAGVETPTLIQYGELDRRRIL